MAFTTRHEVQTIIGYRKFSILLTIALAVVVLDQATKALVAAAIPLHSGFEVIPGYLDLVHVRNPGAAFGMMAGLNPWFRILFFPLVSLAAMAVILWIMLTAVEIPLDLLAGYGLFLGGIVGNLVDRARFFAVVDFIDVHVGSYHWPAFNVADSALCVGTALFFYHFLLRKPGSSAPSSHSHVR
ncbi:MAG: signal peptidase II [Thermodesulfobacteriota bacterium]